MARYPTGVGLVNSHNGNPWPACESHSSSYHVRAPGRRDSFRILWMLLEEETQEERSLYTLRSRLSAGMSFAVLLD